MDTTEVRKRLKEALELHQKYTEKDRIVLKWLIGEIRVKFQKEFAKDSGCKHLPDTPRRSLLLQAAKFLSKHAAAPIPPHILDWLSKSIQLHQQSADLWDAIRGSAHIHRDGQPSFVETLLRIKDILSQCPLNSMSYYHPQFRDDEDAGDPEMLNKVHRQPFSDFGLLPDEGQQWYERWESHEWVLLLELMELKDRIRETWERYVEGEITLVTASTVTSQAVEFARDKEADLARRLGRKTASLDHCDILTSIASLPTPSRPEAVLIYLSRIYDDAFQDFLFLDSWQLLDEYIRYMDPKAAEPSRPGRWIPFDPKKDRSTMNDVLQSIEDRSLLAHHIPEVHVRALLWRSPPDPYDHQTQLTESRHGAIDEHSLISSFRPLLSPNRNGIPVHVVFQWSVWKEIVLVNRRDLQKPQREYHKVARNIHASAKAWCRPVPRWTVLRRGLRESVASAGASGDH